MKKSITSLYILILSITLSACTVGNRMGHSGQNVNVTLGNIDVVDSERAGDLDTTNGNITIGANAVVKSATTTNGNIDIGDGTKINNVTTVNGNIDIGKHAVVQGSVQTTNGNIELSQGTKISGDLTVTSGDIILAENVSVAGDVIFSDSLWSSYSTDEQPMLKIADSATLAGKIHLHTKVKLLLPAKFNQSKIIIHFQEEK